LNCKAKVLQFNPQESTHLPQIFNCPPRRRRTEFTVRSVNLRAVFHQDPNNIAMSTKCRMVKRGRAELVPLLDKIGMLLGNGSNVGYVATLRSLDESLEVTYGTPPHSWE